MKDWLTAKDVLIRAVHAFYGWRVFEIYYSPFKLSCFLFKTNKCFISYNYRKDGNVDNIFKLKITKFVLLGWVKSALTGLAEYPEGPGTTNISRIKCAKCSTEWIL